MKKLSRTMLEALRVMAETGARIAWDGYNRWLLPDGTDEFRVDSARTPTCTVVDALERRGLVEKSYPPPNYRTTYTITEKGKEAVK